VGGRPSVSGNQLVIGLPRLAPGSYRVNWHVISVDGHKTEGSFAFEVRP
jgi:copper resistance protein C